VDRLVKCPGATGPGAGAWLLLGLSLLVASPALAAGAPGVAEPEWIQLRGEKVVRLQAAGAGQSAAQRAEQANLALGVALEGEPAVARIVPEGGAVIIHLGAVPVVTLTDDDARAAGAASLQAHAATVASRLDAVMRSERRRASLAGLVFSISLLVFAGLLAWLLARRLSTLEGQLVRWLSPRPGARPLIVAGVDVTHAATPPVARAMALRVSRLLAQALVLWIWVLFALSLFPESRPAAEWLLRAVLVPVADLAKRLGGALPGLVAAGVIAAVAAAGVRTLRLVFEQAARGEASVPLVSPERAPAIGRLARALVVLLAVLLAAPLLAGGEGNALGRLGEAALLTLALALVPLAAGALAGLPLLFGPRLHLGDRVEVSGHTGRVTAFGVLGLELEEPGGGRTAIPWLLTLAHPLRRLPPAPGDEP